MDANNWVRAVCIVVIFVVLGGLVVSSTGTQNIQDNWPMYRCNPAVIPFAAQLQPEGSTDTTEDNFAYCVQNTMSSFSTTLTQPLDFITNSMGDVVDGITDGLSGVQDQIGSLQGLTGDTGGSLFSSMLNVTIVANVLLTKMSDMQGKMMAIAAALMNTISTVEYTVISMWNGTIGDMIKWTEKIAMAV
jgi:hypothetical protein